MISALILTIGVAIVLGSTAVLRCGQQKRLNDNTSTPGTIVAIFITRVIEFTALVIWLNYCLPIILSKG